ncbi:biotin/lipoate a/B protein ligase family protein [Hirsutella rhossiliensis]|uniref:Biotin/lipoate a/B protein ligase family domain-containing protein n=1 Tax=Hirsutella rhossiliensis TaxID=111463 RepID=A0A9P8MUL1_9HYPO|nr:biotin/lipoate a/B protein ligase family domain-containing protein [Hirsutella rhossiliensis]KAH0961515.1 biotin/lipoate a/B protein ligase family domain-containing protein [Hirsutella rhossiliensis]
MAPPARLNILVYTGTGTSAESVRQCMYSLRRLLSPNYAVIPVAESALLKEPWPSTCALLVIPGGADLGYCRVFDGPGNRRIAEYVRRGGAYLGLCAGGYYGSARCEFELGRTPLEVIGSRELAFFPGTCRGAAFAGFEYHSEKGARAASLSVVTAAFEERVPEHFVSYFNGGGVFVDAPKLGARKVEVLASYDDHLDVDGGDANAAVVLCHVGDGKAVLCGPHPEFAATNLYPQPDVPGYDDLVKKLAADNHARVSFLRACLGRLGLDVCQEEASTPPLSRLHLSAMDSAKVLDLLCAWEEVMDKEDGAEWIRGEADSFRIQSRDGKLELETLRQSLLETVEEPGLRDDGHVDFAAVTKTIVAHESTLPPPDLTPHFNHELYYTSLRRFQTMEEDAVDWGNVLLYGEVVTSTNSLLDKNPKLTSKLPTGFTLSASTQLAGRGRGTNAWVAPPGALMFSVVINHPAHLAMSRPVIFIQYVAAIAVVEAIQSLGLGYENLPVKLKWPNDIYALDPTKPAASAQYVKIGGLLSQCGYCDGSYQIVLGIGINAINPRPTTSLSDLLPANAAPLRLEVLLARILTRLESVHAQFRRQGFSQDLERRYYRHWLHTGQAVSLEAEGGVRARVLGITKDWGMLRVEETDAEGRGTGKMWTLQSDENSFDFWKGLVRRKE